MKKQIKKKRNVIVRTYSAGVWLGELKEQKDMFVVLVNARRIWRWKGANTCSELALYGCSQEYSRVADPVTVELEAIEIISATKKANEEIRKCGWPEK